MITKRIKAFVITTPITLTILCFVLTACEHRTIHTTDPNPPSLISIKDAFEVIAGEPRGLETYTPIEIRIENARFVAASSGNGYILLFDWSYKSPPQAQDGHWSVQWQIDTYVTDNMNETIDNIYYNDPTGNEEFVSITLSPGKQYRVHLLALVTATDDSGNPAALGNVILKIIDIDLRGV